MMRSLPLKAILSFLAAPLILFASPRKLHGTLLLGITTKEGITLAADKRVLDSTDKGKSFFVKHDKFQKVIQLSDRLLFLESGVNRIENREIASVVREEFITNHAEFLSEASVKEASSSLSSFLWEKFKDNWLQMEMPPSKNEDTPLIFWIAGYDKAFAIGEICRAMITIRALGPVDEDGKQEREWSQQLELVASTLDNCNIYWNGSEDAVQLLDRIINPEEVDLEILSQLQKNNIDLLFSFKQNVRDHSIKESVTLAKFLMKSSIQLLNENPALSTRSVASIGGEPSIVVISPVSGISWIQE